MRDFIFRSNYYDEYLDQYNPCEYAEHTVCGRLDLLNNLDDMSDLNIQRVGGASILGACGICAKCMSDKFKAQADLEDVRAEKHLARPKPSENKENNMWFRPMLLNHEGPRTLASELLRIRTLADDFTMATS